MPNFINKSELFWRLFREGIISFRHSRGLIRWDESAPKTKGAKASLLTTGMVLRSDGTYVLIDAVLSSAEREVQFLHDIRLDHHEKRMKLRKLFPEIVSLPSNTASNLLLGRIIEIIGWREYVRRLRIEVNRG